MLSEMTDDTLRAVIAARQKKCGESNQRVMEAINAGRRVEVAQKVRALDETILIVLYAEAHARGWEGYVNPDPDRADA